MPRTYCANFRGRRRKKKETTLPNVLNRQKEMLSHSIGGFKKITLNVSAKKENKSNADDISIIQSNQNQDDSFVILQKIDDNANEIVKTGCTKTVIEVAKNEAVLVRKTQR